MFITQSRDGTRLVILLISLFGCIACTGAAAQAQSKPKDADDKKAEIKTLLKERCELLEKVVEQLTAQYQAGTIRFSEVAQAEREALKASLDVEEDSEKRLATLQKLRKNAEGIVEVAEALSKKGLITEVDVLHAKAVLLEVRIEVLQAEQKAKERK
jgi:outer membrane protein TolC